MRIVNWQELQKQPNGSIIQEILPKNMALGEAQVFSKLMGSNKDFLEASLLPRVITGDSLDQDHPLRNKSPFYVSFPSGFGRDGFFDLDSRLWLLWEEADRLRMATWLTNPKIAAEEQNGDFGEQLLPVEL